MPQSELLNILKNQISDFFVGISADSQDFKELVADSRKGDPICQFAEWIENDFQYLSRRLREEGEVFCLQKMSELGKAIDVSLISGEPLQVPEGFQLAKKTRLPRFCQYLFNRVFDRYGFPLEDTEFPYVGQNLSVQLLRQVFLAFSKVKPRFVENEAEHHQALLDRICISRDTVKANLCNESHGGQLAVVLTEARRLLSIVFDRRQKLVRPLQEFCKEPWGRHGPGAVAGKESGSKKWDFRKYPQTPNSLFKASQLQEDPPKADEDPSSRITCVPKDFRGPRVICMEPKEFQFAQQGILSILVDICHKHFLTRSSIDFEDVTISRLLCRNYGYSTIDLSEASDRISLDLVRLVFPRWVYKLLVQYRTPYVDKHGYQCFATMGSALCFPIQTLLFWTLAKATMNVWSDWKPRRRDKKVPSTSVFIDAFKRQQTSEYSITDLWAPKRRKDASIGALRVFGDDILVPRVIAPTVCDVLTWCGLKINYSKTCINSRVREACGEWVYNGFSCRVVKPKVLTVQNYSDWSAFIDYAEECRILGMDVLADYFKTTALKYYTPTERWGRNLQRAEVRIPVLKVQKCEQLDGYAALYAWSTRSTTKPFSRATKRKVTWKWVRSDTKYLRN
jgi:hypothetical protein